MNDFYKQYSNFSGVSFPRYSISSSINAHYTNRYDDATVCVDTERQKLLNILSTKTTDELRMLVHVLDQLNP